jgi:hypothetical protein
VRPENEIENRLRPANQNKKATKLRASRRSVRRSLIQLY